MKRFVRRHLRAGLIGAAVVLAVVGIGAMRPSLYRIATDSMSPDFPAGTMVIDSGALPLVPHRAVTFTADGAVVTHVLLGFNKDGSLITRGIANPVPDRWPTPIYPRDVRGRVLLRILLFAPAFWSGLRGLVVIAGLTLAATTFIVGRRAMPASIAAQSSRSRRTESSA